MMGMDVSVGVKYVDHHYLDSGERERTEDQMRAVAARLHDDWLAHARGDTLHLQHRPCDGESFEASALAMLEVALRELGVPNSELGSLVITIDWT
jgi:hypothetical protein